MKEICERKMVLKDANAAPTTILINLLVHWKNKNKKSEKLWSAVVYMMLNIFHIKFILYLINYTVYNIF